MVYVQGFTKWITSTTKVVAVDTVPGLSQGLDKIGKRDADLQLYLQLERGEPTPIFLYSKFLLPSQEN